MLRDQMLDGGQFTPVEAVVCGQGERVEPELRLIPARLDVDVRRLLPLVAVKEEAESSNPQDRRHRFLNPYETEADGDVAILILPESRVRANRNAGRASHARSSTAPLQ